MNSGPHSILTVVVVVCFVYSYTFLTLARSITHFTHSLSITQSLKPTQFNTHTGKTTLLNNIANWEELEGFPKHLRVLHVKQELNTENEETTVINAVLDADIERTQLIQREKQLTLKLEQNNDNGESGETKETETTDATTAEEFTKDMKELKDVYDRLQLLGADTGTFTFCCHVWS